MMPGQKLKNRRANSPRLKRMKVVSDMVLLAFYSALTNMMRISQMNRKAYLMPSSRN